MNRTLTGGADKIQSQPILTYRVTPESIFGSIKIPVGANRLYVTGVAAGGKGLVSPSDDPSQWFAGKMVIASSPSGNLVVGTSNKTSSNPAVPLIIDPIGRKVGFVSYDNGGIASEYATKNSNGDVFVNDAGFFIVTGYSTKALLIGREFGRKISFIGTANVVSGSKNVAISDSKSLKDTLAVWITGSQNQLSVMRGVSDDVSASSVYSGNTFTSIFFENDYFFAGEKGGLNNTRLYYSHKDDAVNPNNWDNVVISASEEDLAGICFGNGIYVAAYTDGSIFTADSPAGPWTERTSGVTHIANIKFAGGRFVGHGSAHALSSADGASWTPVPINSLGAPLQDIYNFAYNINGGEWCIMVNETPMNNLLVSSDGGITWSKNPAFKNVINPLGYTPATATIAAHPSGLIVSSINNGSHAVIFDVNRERSGYVMSSSNDGGSLRVIRGSTGEDLLELKGGLSNGIGGSSDLAGYNRYSTSPGYEDSGSPPKIESINENMYGIKIPGGASASNSTEADEASRGGESIMSSKSKTGSFGYGGGTSPTGSSPGGGGGEGIVRRMIDVTPGEEILFSAGLPKVVSGVTSSIKSPGPGKISFEFEQ